MMWIRERLWRGCVYVFGAFLGVLEYFGSTQTTRKKITDGAKAIEHGHSTCPDQGGVGRSF